jgi:putative DNA primase/helicase
MFCFSSIGVNMKQHAARTRVTVMSLYTAPETEESLAQYNGMMARIFETLTDDYIARMQARAVHLLPVIRKNAKVFAEAAAVVLKDRRMGDQIGTLLAGAFALHSNNETTREFAQQWIEKQAWDEVTEVAEAKDEASCLAYILSYQLRVETQTGVKSRTIGELIQTAAYIVHDHDVATADAVDILRRHGILVAQGRIGYTVSFANSYPALERVLADTAWQKSYGRTLKRLPGAEQHLPKKYGATSHRGVEFDIGKIV